MIFSIICYPLRGGGICIDCGAHSGLITDIILHCGGISYAFEPNLHLNYFLSKKYENNPKVFLRQQAVDNRNYTTDFLMFGGRMLSQGNRIIKSKQDMQTQKTYKVGVIDLCEFIEKEILSKHERIYFLKLDVEGVEFGIMDKLIEKKLYEKIDFIACETHEYMFEDGNEKIAKLKNKITEYEIGNILLDWI